jgi:5-formyltetrahydrofolate cyclo-ligase
VRAACANALARRLVGCVRLRRSQRIGCYLAQDGELDLAPLMKRLRNIGKQLYLPVLRGPRLWFMPLDSRTRLVRNRFGILEPDAPASARCLPQALDLVLAPLVAFDNSGRRLGMGGGYYDRTFAYLLNRRYWRRPLLIGIAYDLQRVPALVARRWDVPLDGIATESGLRYF